MNVLMRALACLFCISFLAISTSLASEYVPWQGSDYVLFQSDTDKQQTLQLLSPDRGWRKLNNFSGFGSTLIYSGTLSEKVMLYSPDTIEFQTFIDFDDPIDSINSINILPCNTGEVRIAEKNGSLTVIAGNFDQVIHLELTGNCSDAGVTQIWFAKNIGIIQWTELNIAGEETYQLAEAKIGRKIFPESRGLVVSGRFPESKIWINQMPPLPAPTPKATLGLQIENNLSHDVTYQFGSSQRYDIIIRDDTDSIITQWSDGKVFLSVVEDIVIAPGGTFNIADVIDLVDREGNVIPPGTYEFEIYLTSVNSARVSQTIEIDHAQ